MPDKKSRDGDPSRFSSPRCLSYLPGVDVVSGLVAVLVVVHFLLLLAGGPIGAPWYYQNFALSWGEFSHGKIWQLLTYGTGREPQLVDHVEIRKIEEQVKRRGYGMRDLVTLVAASKSFRRR